MSIQYRSPSNFDELNDTIFCSMCSFDWVENGFSDDHFFSRIVKFDPWFSLNNTRACFLDGQAVSVVVVFERPMRIGSSVIRMGGLGSVGTHPAYRRKGYSAQVLSNTVDYLTDSGFDISLLFTGINHHYEKADWVTYPVSYRKVDLNKDNLPLNKISDNDISIDICNFSKDINDLMTIYEQFNQNRTGTIVRNQAYWQNQPKWRSQTNDLFWLAKTKDDGEILAYLKGDEKHLLEIGSRIDSPLATSALDQLVTHFVHNRLDNGQEQIRVNQCQEVEGILDRLGLHSYICQDDHFMFRITNFSSLLSKLTPQLEMRIAKSDWKGWNGSIRISYELDSATMTISNGEISLTKNEPSINLELNHLQVLQLIFGELPALVLSDHPILSVLFPPDHLIHWSPDNF